jgi:hypothetical protein
VPGDAGYYVRAITQVGPGKNVLAFSKRLTWAEYVKIWSEITGVDAKFSKTTVAEHDKLSPGGPSEEMAEMYAYAMDFGYDGSDPSVVYARDVRLPLIPIKIGAHAKILHSLESTCMKSQASKIT